MIFTCVEEPEPVPGPGEANEETEKVEEPVQLFSYLNMVHLFMLDLYGNTDGNCWRGEQK